MTQLNTTVLKIRFVKKTIAIAFYTLGSYIKDMASQKLPYAHKGNLVDGPVSGHLTRLTIPMIWGIFAIISFQLVDTYFISLLGTEELAAISFTFPVTYGLFAFVMGFGIAMSSVASRLIGEQDIETVKRVVGHGLGIVLILSIILAGLGLVFHDAIFSAMGADDEMLTLISEYMMIWFAGLVFVSVPLVGNAAIRAGGDSFTPAMIMGIVAVVNLILDPILIFGLLGAPRMEMQGAALATIIANFCAAGAGLYVLAVKKKMLCFKNACKISEFGDSMKRLLVIALPAGLTNAIQPMVNAFILSLLAVYGAKAVAGFGVVNRLEAFAFIVLMALSTGMAPVIGQNWGAQKYDRVHKTLKLAIGFGVVWSAITAIIFAFFAKPLSSIFSTDPAVIEVAILYLTIVPFSYILGNMLKGWASAFNAMGMPKKAFMLVVLEMIILMIPAVMIGSHLAGIKGIFIAMACVYVIVGLVSTGYGIYTCRKHEKTP